LQPHLPDRRRAERRRHNIEPLLRTHGWAEVRLPESGNGQIIE
jgi:Holliday junction resolvase